jgi:hypothetical protein
MSAQPCQEPSLTPCGAWALDRLIYLQALVFTYQIVRSR